MRSPRRSRGTPRIAGRLLRRVRDFAARRRRRRRHPRRGRRRALKLLDVDSIGLDQMDRRYLDMVAINFGGGPVGIETIAAALSEAARRHRGHYRALSVPAGLSATHAARPGADAAGL